MYLYNNINVSVMLPKKMQYEIIYYPPTANAMRYIELK